MKKNLIFIFSLPRSGSTLLQRSLCTHDKIKSEAETWILLPLLNFPEISNTAFYDSNVASLAVKEFLDTFPKKDRVFQISVKKMVTTLYYSKIENGEYFIDKTPRYFHIIDQIVGLFPEAKFIFLFRNPLDIYLSMMKTWTENKFIRSKYLYSDLTIGPELLARGYSKYKNISFKVTYNTLVNNPNSVMTDLYNYLGLENQVGNLDKIGTIKFKGTFGDQIITKKKRISAKSINDNRKNINTIVRKYIFIKFINGFNDEYLKCCELKKADVLKRLKEIKVRKIGILHFVDYLISILLRKFLKQSMLKYSIIKIIKDKLFNR